MADDLEREVSTVLMQRRPDLFPHFRIADEMAALVVDLHAEIQPDRCDDCLGYEDDLGEKEDRIYELEQEVDDTADALNLLVDHMKAVGEKSMADWMTERDALFERLRRFIY